MKILIILVLFTTVIKCQLFNISETNVTTLRTTESPDTRNLKEIVDVKANLTRALKQFEDDYLSKRLKLDNDLESYVAASEEEFLVLKQKEEFLNKIFKSVSHKIDHYQVPLLKIYPKDHFTKKIDEENKAVRQMWNDYLQTETLQNILRGVPEHIWIKPFLQKVQKRLRQIEYLKEQSKINDDLINTYIIPLEELEKEKLQLHKELSVIKAEMDKIKNEEFNFEVRFARLLREYRYSVSRVVHEADKKFSSVMSNNIKWMTWNIHHRGFPLNSVACDHDVNDQNSYVIRSISFGAVHYGKFTPSNQKANTSNFKNFQFEVKNI